MLKYCGKIHHEKIKISPRVLWGGVRGGLWAWRGIAGRAQGGGIFSLLRINIFWRKHFWNEIFWNYSFVVEKHRTTIIALACWHHNGNYLCQEDTLLYRFLIILIHPEKMFSDFFSILENWVFYHKSYMCVLVWWFIILCHLSYMTPSTPSRFKCWTVARSFWSSVQAKMI